MDVHVQMDKAKLNKGIFNYKQKPKTNWSLSERMPESGAVFGGLNAPCALLDGRKFGVELTLLVWFA